MEENTENTFQDAIEWANSDKKSGTRRKKGGINLFYLILGAVAILVLLILIVYLIGRDPDNINALEMMKDDQYTYGGDYEEEYIIDDGDYDGSEYIEVGYDGTPGDGYEYIDEYVDIPPTGNYPQTNAPSQPAPSQPLPPIQQQAMSAL